MKIDRFVDWSRMLEETEDETVVLREKHILSFEANLAQEKLRQIYCKGDRNLTEEDSHLQDLDRISSLLGLNRCHSVGVPQTHYIPYRQKDVLRDLQQQSFIHSNLAKDLRKSMPDEYPHKKTITIGSVFKRDSFLRQSWNTILRRNKSQRRKSMSTEDITRVKLKKVEKLLEEKNNSSNNEGSSDGAIVNYKATKKGHKRSSSSSSCMSTR